jgi:general secretion pathway protein G
MNKKFLNETVRTSEQGFSLLEILIALTLLAIVATFVGGKIFDQLAEGQINSTKIQMSNLESRLKEFKRKCGFFPTTEQGLEALLTKPSGGRECKDYPANGFIEESQLPKDPWDHDFIYESDGKTFNMYSYGPDGAAGGDGNDADIYLRPASKGASSAPKAEVESAPAAQAPASQSEGGPSSEAPAQQ